MGSGSVVGLFSMVTCRGENNGVRFRGQSFLTMEPDPVVFLLNLSNPMVFLLNP